MAFCPKNWQFSCPLSWLPLGSKFQISFLTFPQNQSWHGRFTRLGVFGSWGPPKAFRSGDEIHFVFHSIILFKVVFAPKSQVPVGGELSIRDGSIPPVLEKQSSICVAPDPLLKIGALWQESLKPGAFKGCLVVPVASGSLASL